MSSSSSYTTKPPTWLVRSNKKFSYRREAAPQRSVWVPKSEGVAVAKPTLFSGQTFRGAFCDDALYKSTFTFTDSQAEALCCPVVRPSVCYQTCEHDILNMNEPISMPIGTSGPRGKSMKRSNLGIRRSKVKGHCTRPKMDLEAWRRHHSWPDWAELLLSLLRWFAFGVLLSEAVFTILPATEHRQPVVANTIVYLWQSALWATQRVMASLDSPVLYRRGYGRYSSIREYLLGSSLGLRARVMSMVL